MTNKWTGRRRRVALTLGLALAGTLVPVSSAQGAPQGCENRNNNQYKKLLECVTADGVLEHLEAFQAIADANGGNRAAGQPGYDASVAYVVEQLTAAGYTPSVQEFTFGSYQLGSELVRLEPEFREFAYGSEFLENGFNTGTPEGSAEGELVPVEPGSTTSGCETNNFPSSVAGNIALIQRGGCGFAVKAVNAEVAGAAGAIIWDNVAGPMLSMVGDAEGLTIPVVYASLAAGENLADTPGATVRVTVDSVERTAYNVIAQTSHGRTDNVVMAGAHLDGVLEGAGINDNASGSAALLEVALLMKKVRPNNAVRFAWWGAEEEGLLGSEHYVSQLDDQAIEDIALYLNFDMIASPNYTTGIYDGDNSGGTAADGFIPDGSAEIEDVFEAFYESRGLPYVDSEFSGRSDYGPFIEVRIPAGGLFTGAEVPKTAGEAALFGGVAGASKDPCYHQFCDNLRGEGQDAALYAQLAADYRLVGNVNVDALDQNADGMAAAIITFAYDTSTVNGEPRAPGKSHNAGRSATRGHQRPGEEAATA